MEIKGKSVLVTGGAGFIGSHLVDRLIEETPSELTVVDNFSLGSELNLRQAKEHFPRLGVYALDAANRGEMVNLLRSKGVDVVFNLAVVPLSASLVRPRWVFERNVAITLCLCELARNALFQTLVHFSSSEAYGTCRYAPMNENHPLAPTTSYAASKAASDHLVLSYVESFGIDATIVRPFNTYGPRQNQGLYAGVIPVTIKRILDGQAPMIYGDGEQTRDFVYVTETADAAVRLYDCVESRGRVVNIASGTEVSMNDLVGAITRYIGCEREVAHGEGRLGDVRRLVGDYRLATEITGFRPIVGLECGLRQTVQWFKENQR